MSRVSLRSACFCRSKLSGLECGDARRAVARSGAPRRRAGRRPGRPDDAARRSWRSCTGSGSVSPLRTSEVAPFQHELVDADLDWPELIKNGLGQLTRPFGTRAGRRRPPAPHGSPRLQAEIMAAGRFGIPAVVHEECLTGFMAQRRDDLPDRRSPGAPRASRRWSSRWRRRIGADHAGGRCAPGARARTRRDAGRALGPHRGDHRRGPAPGRGHRHGVRARPASRPASCHPQALRRLLGLAGRPQLRARSRSGPRELADVLLPPFLALR